MASTMRPLSRSVMSTARRKTASARLAAINRQFSSTPRAMAFEVKKLGVIGAGQMVRRSSISPGGALLTNLQGLGIALVAAQKAEIPVILVDNAQASLDKGLKFADKLLEKDVAKSRITEEIAKATRERLRP